ncbi:copper amine oxidase [Paenibacillus sp. HJL G12]|uniref:Copper amine oxidase n=1 Tax=Paenibacillus dendrobii TaxID=2691084 RepID=A0A7X3IL48_9BACL|nr:stalk domain-containing protein [Paenibacillus dendrobii]MWV45929.1 copper amine oxidase [Paenibacillus dendrobii]
MQSYKKAWPAVLPLFMALMMGLSVPAFAFGEGSRPEGLLAEVKTLPDLQTAPGTGSGLDLIPHEWRITERSLMRPDGSVLLTDAVHHVIWKVKDGMKSVFAGLELPLGYDGADRPLGAYLDGAADKSFFDKPVGIAADEAGNVYVADSGNHAIRKIDTQGQVTTVAGNGVLGFADGKGAEAQFDAPEDVAVAKDGTIYVADTMNHAVRKVDPDGEVSTLSAVSERAVEVYPGVISAAGSYKDGPIAEALFNEPSGLALDDKGNLYVSDSGNQVIRYIDFGAGKVSTVAGKMNSEYTQSTKALYADGGYRDGSAQQAEFSFPKGIAWSSGQQQLYVADSQNGAIRVIKNNTVYTLLGSLKGETGKGDGTEKSAALDHPEGVSVDPDGSGGWITGNGTRTWELIQLPAGRPDRAIAAAYGTSWLSIQPEMKQGQIMVPLRDTAGGLGVSVMSVSKSTVALQQDGRQVQFKLPENIYTREDRLYVPLRLLAESLGKDVQWLREQQDVVIRDK